MNWIKFKDRSPSNDLGYIYISDGEMIKITPVLLCISGSSTFEYWMPVFMPELPEKELHECKIGWYRCWETSDNKLQLQDRFNCNQQIDFCPFCGYSIGEE